MLERATHLNAQRGGGSLTALPIIETEAQDISAYIPTNLISITDGQIYLSPSLFELGVLPAVDVGKSVSRVGGKAQRAAYRAVAGDLKLAYAQFEELETFARFGARLDAGTRKIIDHGRRIRACLKQSELAPMDQSVQIIILLALTAELFDPVPLEQMAAAKQAVQAAAAKIPTEMGARFESAEHLSDEDRHAIVEIARQALVPFQPKPVAQPPPALSAAKKGVSTPKAAAGPKPPAAQSKPAPASKTGPQLPPVPTGPAKPAAPKPPTAAAQTNPKPDVGAAPAPAPPAKSGPVAKPHPPAQESS
jgi:F-type H+-transporting ATPase subunit alpha